VQELARREAAVAIARELSVQTGQQLPPTEFDLYCHYQKLPTTDFSALLNLKTPLCFAPAQTTICHCSQRQLAVTHPHEVLYHQSYDVRHSLYLPSFCSLPTCEFFHLGVFYVTLPTQYHALPTGIFSERTASKETTVAETDEDFMMQVLFADETTTAQKQETVEIMDDPHTASHLTSSSVLPLAKESEESIQNMPINFIHNSVNIDDCPARDQDEKGCEEKQLSYGPGDAIIFNLSQLLLDEEFMVMNMDVV